MIDRYILDIEDSGDPDTPRLVGPFRTADDAREWGDNNAVGCMYRVRPLTEPYVRAA